MGIGRDALTHSFLVWSCEFCERGFQVNSTSMKQLRQLNQDGYSPFHLAAANGHSDMVKLLLSLALEPFRQSLCLKRDKEGRIPLHCAVARGWLDLIEVLIRACPESILNLTVQRETSLHLAVKNNQCETFFFLVQATRMGNWLNQADSDGNTVLHLASARKQFQTVKWMVSQPSLDVNAKNSGHAFSFNHGFDLLHLVAVSAIEYLLGRANILPLLIEVEERGRRHSVYSSW